MERDFSLHCQDSACLDSQQFEGVRARFQALADRLSDEQMLDLADIYHEALRQRRAIRARHAQACRPGQYTGPVE